MEQQKVEKEVTPIKRSKEEIEGIESMKKIISLNTDDEVEIRMKFYLLDRAYYVVSLPFYERGCMLFYNEVNDKLYGDKVLIATYSEGETQGHSERLGLDVDKHFVVDEYVLLPKSSIKFLEVEQNTCPNPDCKSCVDGEPTPATLNIVTEARTIPLAFFSQAEALEIMILLNCWMSGGLKQFVETPFEDEYSIRNKKKNNSKK